jgi:cob(I)alamin adenosyltransferase
MSEDDVQATETGPVHDEARHAMKMAKKKTAREKIMATKTARRA